MRGAVDAGEELLLRVGFVGQPFLHQRIGHLLLGIKAVNQLLELVADEFREGFRIGVALLHRQAAFLDPVLERS